MSTSDLSGFDESLGEDLVCRTVSEPLEAAASGFCESMAESDARGSRRA